MAISRAPRRHIAPSELVDCRDACPVCLDRAPRRRVARVQADPDVHMLACGRCGGCSASHMPRADVLEAFYAGFYAGSACGITFSEPRRFAHHLVKALPPRTFETPVRILDFGGGDGSLATAVAERLLALGRTRSAEILVVDFSNVVPGADERIAVRHQSPREAIAGRHDLVLASAVLEHLPDLHAVVQTLYAAMAPKAFFYARTPCNVPLKKVWPRLDLMYPAHLHDLGSSFWNRFADTFCLSFHALVSQPSVVASRFRDDPVRTFAAHVLKLPAHLENRVSPRGRRGRIWRVVGGWEVLFQRA